MQIRNRKTFKAYDGVNNIFNLAYEILKWKVHRAIIKAKLEPYLGFLHSEQWGKPSLVCDLQELYRYLIDDFIIEYCRKIRKKDFIMKNENFSNKKHGLRQHDVISARKNIDALKGEKIAEIRAKLMQI